MRTKLLGASVLALAAATWLQPQSAAAQTSAPSATANSQLEEVTVTARKREENLQTAPVAVTAFSADRLQEVRATQLTALSSLAPNLVISPAVGAGSGANFTVRGIGVADPSPYLDAPNALYIDGVLRARTSGSLSELGDLERVEILRGPQGTLFGRNTTGGAVSIFTPAPTQDFGVRAVVGYGTDNERTLRTTLNTGVLGGTGLRAKLSYYHRDIEGVVENPGVKASRGPGAQNNNGYALRVAGDYGQFKVDYSFDYTLNKNDTYYDQITFVTNGALLNYFSQSPQFGGAPFVVAPNRLESFATRIFPQQIAETVGHAVTLDYEFSDALALKSITAYRELVERRPFNTATQGLLLGRIATPGAPGGFTIQEISPLQTTRRDLDEKQFSQEFQALGTIGNVNYVAGLYFFNEEFDEVNDNFNTTVLANNLGQQRLARRMYHYETESAAGFAQASWRPETFDNKLELTGGVRYTRDKKSIVDYAFVNGVQSRFFTGSDSWTNTSFSGSVSYQWTPSVMTYVRGSTGYKAGGFAPGSAVASFSPEKATSIEAGIKSQLFDNRLRLNLAAFYTQYKDLQIAGRVTDAVTGNRVSTLTNAGKAHYSGGEIEFNAILGGGFQLDGNAGFVNPEYDEFPFFDGVRDINVANEARFPWISNATADIGLRYDFPQMGIGNLSARINYTYQASRYFFALARVNVNNERLRAPAQEFLNARVTLKNIPVQFQQLKALRLEFYADNILDKDRFLAAIDSTNYGSVVWGRGRSYGLQLTADF